MRYHEFIKELKIDNHEGWGQTPNNSEIDWFGIRVLMTPETFLKLSSELNVDNKAKKKIDIMIKHHKEGGTFASPMLYIDVPSVWREGDLKNYGKITDHEGRHRMNAQLKIEGNKPIETHIIVRSPRYEWRNKHITKEIIEKLNSGLFTQSGSFLPGPFFDML